MICCNHISYFDPVVLGICFRRKIFFMGKSEFFTERGFFVRKFMESCGVFAVQRDKSDIKAVNRASEILKSGKPVGIFPQGGIRKISSFEPKAGAALISIKEQVPILPVSVYTESKIRPFSRITLRIGKPIYPSEKKSLKEARNLNRILKERIIAQLEEGHWQK